MLEEIFNVVSSMKDVKELAVVKSTYSQYVSVTFNDLVKVKCFFNETNTVADIAQKVIVLYSNERTRLDILKLGA